MSEDKLSKAAKELGQEDGLEMAQICNATTVSKDGAKKMIEGYEAGDEKIMIICPDPLSGEWGDDPTPMRLLDRIANKADIKSKLKNKEIAPDTDDLLDVYEESYRESFWDHVMVVCKGVLANGN